MSERFKTKKIKSIPIEVEDISDDGSIISTKYNIYVKSFSTQAVDKIIPYISEYVANLFKSQVLKEDAIDAARKAQTSDKKTMIADMFSKDFSGIVGSIMKRTEEQPKFIRELFLLLVTIIPDGLGKDDAIPADKLEEFVVENVSPEWQLQVVKESLDLFDIARYAENFTEFQEQTIKFMNPAIGEVTPGIGQTQ